MAHVIYIPKFPPNSIGHGGNHRAYQIWYDLINNDEGWKVEVLESRQKNKNLVKGKLSRYIDIINRRFKLLISSVNPFARLGDHLGILLNSSVEGGRIFGSVDPSDYIERLDKINDCVVCVIDDWGCFNILKENQKRNIPTIICPHNIETFDINISPSTRSTKPPSFLSFFQKEIEIYSICQERLLISKLEANILNGLGYRSKYYPYRPVGDIRKRCLSIREERIENSSKDLFVMLGTAEHLSTGYSMDRFLSNAINRGIPDRVNIVVGGKGTDRFLNTVGEHPAIHIRGWIEQDELDGLLIRAKGVIVPQDTGFGALTRLSEYSCMGIPIIMAKNPTHALDVPPGVMIAEDDWSSWYQTIDRVSKEVYDFELEEYLTWERHQESIVIDVIRNYVE